MKVTMDSQCFTYICEAINGVSKPEDSLAAEKIALFRSYLYLPDTLYVSPTVIQEFQNIRDAEKRRKHEECLVLFSEVFIENRELVEKFTKNYSKYHSGLRDCAILAEAEVSEFDFLLSYDSKFLKNLSKHCNLVNLVSPSEFWSKLNIQKGIQPDKIPHHTNPLGVESWWLW
jgi:predicted nucleic-acid-binding protein